MKKHFLIFASLFLFSANAVFSQTTDGQISKIRAIYAEINKRIEAGLKDNTQGYHYAAWTIGGKGDAMQWSAVGTMETRDEIWFVGGDKSAGEEGEKAQIHKIVLNYKAAADLRSRTEYYFDESDDLIFIYINDNSGENGKAVERRFYYAKGKLLRITRGTKERDANFSAQDLEESSEESGAAAKAQKKYAELIDG